MASSLIELVMENFEAHLASDGREVKLPCPLCGDHKERLFINLSTFRWICHNCAEAGGLISFLERVMEKDPFEAYHLATKIQPKEQRVLAVPKGPASVFRLPGQPLDDQNSDVQAAFLRYLYDRHITDDLIQHYEMRYEIIGRFRGRVIIPVRQDSICRGFIARAIVWWEQPKVLYPPGMKTSELLFGIDDIEGDAVVLTEGVFDAIALLPYAICTFGAHLAAEQRALLHRKGIKHVTIMWDGDEAGRRAAAKAARELKSDGFEVRIAALPEGVDPASATQEQLDRALDQAFGSRIELPKHSIRNKLAEE